MMDILSLPSVAALFEAVSFGELLPALADAATALLGAERIGEPSLILDAGTLTQAEPAGAALVVNASALHKRRHFRAWPLNERVAAAARNATRPLILDLSPATLLDLDADQAALPLCAATPAMLLVPLVAEPRPAPEPDRDMPVRRPGPAPRADFWLIPLKLPNLTLDPTAMEALTQVASAAAHVVRRILQHEQTEIQNQQLQHLHDAMLKVMVATDKGALLSHLLGILTRQFGFARVLIAQVHPETQTLRSELHSGFNAGFAPLTIPLSNTRHFLVRALNTGETIIIENDATGLPADLPACITQTRADRRVILPLKLGAHPVGLIYADQPRHDGAPLFRPVLDIFARLAAVAIENTVQRARAEQRAETDPLTGLHNRFYLDKVLEIELPRVKRYNHPISLLMIDLDDFKRVNDTYGHQFGDYILRETAALIQANVRRPDVVVRYGGDEFVVLMVNTSLEQALIVRNRIEQAFIERNRLLLDERQMIKISLGLRSADAATIESLLHEADMEMYAHKARQVRVRLLKALIAGQPDKIEAADRVVGSLCNILYKKAPYYPSHARRVARLALELAHRLGLSEDEIQTLALAALLHDVGKVSIPTEILQKIEPLTATEIEAMRHHTALGDEFFQGLEHLEPVRPLIRSHHERFDGQTAGPFPGYPEGLCGEWIPLGARILKLAESADCMLHGRPYRAGMDPDTVTRLIREEAGKSFDPHMVNLLLADRNWHANLDDPQRIADLLNLVSQ